MPRMVKALCEPDDLTHSQYMARLWFLEAIQTCVPQVLDDLSGAPYEAFCEAGITPINKGGQVEFHFLDLPRLNQILPEICATLIKYKIHVEWIHEFVVLSLFEWSRDPEAKWPECKRQGKHAWWQPGFVARTAFSDVERTFHFESKCPDPTCFPYDRRDEKAGLVNDLVKDFRKQLEAHLDRLTAIPPGFVRVKSKDDLRHFEWLALYIVEDQRQEDIAARYDSDVKAISKAINQTAKLINLPLPDNRGRPTKTPPTDCRKIFPVGSF